MLIAFIALHLCNPLVHHRILLLERLLQFSTSSPHGMILSPVGVAVVEDLIHVGEKLVLIGVLVAIHLVFHRAQVHGLLDLLKIVGHTIRNGIDGLFERANQTGPEPWSCWDTG